MAHSLSLNNCFTAFCLLQGTLQNVFFLGFDSALFSLLCVMIVCTWFVGINLLLQGHEVVGYML